MVGRRWNAWVEGGQLVVERRRFLPWSRAEIRRIPVTAVIRIEPGPVSPHATNTARAVVAAGPGSTEIYDLRFTPEGWLRAEPFLLGGPAPRAVPPHRSGPPSPPTESSDWSALGSAPPRSQRSERHGIPPQRVSASGPPAGPSAPVPSSASEASAHPSAPVMRPGDGKRTVWLWKHNGTIHASLSPVVNATKHRLTPAQVARLLLADPSKAMPAIRALTGLNNNQQALARLRSWLQHERVVTLHAAGRARRLSLHQPAGANADGSVRTVRGGLPSLGKRRR